MLRIYLDDCADHNLLAKLLQQAGYEVQTPRGAGTKDIADRAHLEYASQHNYTLLTFNPDDFHDLHQEWQNKGLRHEGILLIYLENDITKDMRYSDIVRAINNLVVSGLPIANEIHTLNHWR
jgi:predicted nuclease of predicted toxin-antitoxin system